MRRNGHNKPTDPLTLANLVIPGVTLDDDAYAKLLMRLDLYNDTILARQYDQGQPGPAYALDPLDVAACIGGLAISTPPLPRNCLFWQKSGDGERLAVYCEPRVWTVNVSEGKERQRLAVPMPGLVWVGCGLTYGLYAVKGSEWPSPETALWTAPVPNMSGSICRGNVEFPAAGAATIWAALGLFFESDFNSHLSNGKSLAHRENVLGQWTALAGAEVWPEDDLVHTQMTLGKLMEG